VEWFIALPEETRGRPENLDSGEVLLVPPGEMPTGKERFSVDSARRTDNTQRMRALGRALKLQRRCQHGPSLGTGG
jgi:hypothetical protein